MNEETILKKAIEKAGKNGFKRGEHILESMEKGKSYNINAMTRNIGFSHDFLKAFFGEMRFECHKCKKPYSSAEPHKDCGKEGDQYAEGHWESGWRHHAQQLVLEEEPLKYLEKYL